MRDDIDEVFNNDITSWPPLYSRPEIQKVIEHGLRTGLWSVNDVTRNQVNPVLPSLEFLEANPQFRDRHFRDMEAFRRRGQPTTTP
jgi:hypothetical protein